MVLLTNMFDQAYGAVLLPVWVEQEYGSPLGLGAIGGTFGVGAVLGSVLFAWLGPRLPRRGSYAWGFLVGGAPRFFVLAVAATLPPVLAVSFVAGLGVGAINPALASTEYERVPPHLQARVLGALGAVATAGMPLGALLGGLLVAADRPDAHADRRGHGVPAHHAVAVRLPGVARDAAPGGRRIDGSRKPRARSWSDSRFPAWEPTIRPRSRRGSGERLGDGPRGRGDVGGARDRATDDEQVGAVGERLLGGGHALLVADVGTGGAHARA